MRNDPFRPSTTIGLSETSFWDEELGKLYKYRQYTILNTLSLEGKIARNTPIQKLKEVIDKTHKELDEKSYKRFRERLSNRKILLVTTGGTILCRTNTEGFLAPVLEGKDILGELSDYMIDMYDIIETIPFRNLREVEQAVRGLSERGLMDSAKMTSGLQLRLAKHIAEQIKEHKPLGVIVLHGTDSMANTAAALSLYFEELTVPVILTGSMIPPERKESDAFDNLKSSIIFAAAAPIKPGVYVCFDKRLYPGTRVIHDASDVTRAFRAILKKEKGSVARVFQTEKIEVWKALNLKKETMPEIISEEEARGHLGSRVGEVTRWTQLTSEKDPDLIILKDLTRSTEVYISEDFFDGAMLKSDEEKSKGADAKVLDLEKAVGVIGITEYSQTKEAIVQILKMYDMDYDVVAEEIFKEEGADIIKKILGAENIIRAGNAYRKIIPLNERTGIVFRGFSGTVDDRIVLPLITKGVPVVLGSKVRFDIVTNTGEKYATDTQLVKAGVIYSEDMVEDMLAAKLSIVLGLLSEKLRKHKRDDIINNPQKYLYFVKLLMLINFKGEVTIIALEGKRRGTPLPHCRYPLSIMAEYLAKNGYKDNDNVLFRGRDDYNNYFFFFRRFWLAEQVEEPK